MNDMMRALVLMLALTAGPALATPEYVLPTLFDVADVAADDVLNIRSQPNASAEIVGSLPPDATEVEITALDPSGRWGQVNTGERAGWVAMRFLQYRTDVWAEDRVPATLICSGTEPFWSFTIEGDRLAWRAPDAQRDWPGVQIRGTGWARDPHRGLFARDGQSVLAATITPKQCSDGMSDMAFGLEATVLVQDGAAPLQMYSGCCRIGAR
ncbi:peptide-binding protein [Paracoccus jeotgali]|uniref:Peptide-binding protein n=2 Tax=Paracoccus jeotgali TaxID=2065379 RepID=A0A2K9MGZ8_9RHOB|nr:peptide-binding protein [Paracoccus jeotgali]